MARKQLSESATVSVRQAQQILGCDQISLNALYRAVASGSVPSVRIGTRVLIPKAWLQRQLGCK